MVYGFAPSASFPYPLSVAQVTPAEWAAIQEGRLALPDGWRSAGMRRVEPRKRSA